MLRTLVAALATGAALAVPAAAKVQAPADLPPQPLRTIPFELYDGRIYIQASVAGSGPRTFLVDTGAQITHLTAELVRETGLEAFGDVGITGTGRGRVEGSYVRLSGLDLGGVMLPTELAISASADALFGSVVTASGKQFDGVIGYDLFAAFVVEIDYVGRLIRLYDPTEYVDQVEAEIVPISLVDNKPYFTGTVTFATQAIEANLHLDTGSSGAIGFNGDFVAERNLLAIAGPTLPSMSRGIGGATPSRLGRARSLTIGNLVLPGPFATFALAQGKGVSEQSAGRIGGAILRRFTLTINYPARTIALLPNANFSRPLETDMSGLALISRQGAVEIFRVEEGSAGAEAGLRSGDRLISIDGRAVSTLSLEAIRGLLMQHGETRTLVVVRSGGQLGLPVRLRRRI